MPAAGRKLSHDSRYSCVNPGPPCSSSSLMRGLLPIRLVHTENFPKGVSIGIRRTPPLRRSLRPRLSRYSAVGALLLEGLLSGVMAIPRACALCLLEPARTERDFGLRRRAPVGPQANLGQ